MTLLSKALEISRAILSAIDEQDWDEVNRLQQQRQPLIDEYYGGSFAIDPQQTVELKQLNDQIVQRLSRARQHTRELQLNLQQGGKASRAYLANIAE